MAYVQFATENSVTGDALFRRKRGRSFQDVWPTIFVLPTSFAFPIPRSTRNDNTTAMTQIAQTLTRLFERHRILFRHGAG